MLVWGRRLPHMLASVVLALAGVSHSHPHCLLAPTVSEWWNYELATRTFTLDKAAGMGIWQRAWKKLSRAYLTFVCC